jgi:hypothetical protein
MDPNDYEYVIPPAPTLPCICGHSHLAHGTETETSERYEWDDDHRQEIRALQRYPQPVCYECDRECLFTEMTNLEYIEFKANGNN